MPKNREYHVQLPFLHVDASKRPRMRYLYGVRVARDLVNKLALFFMPIYLFQFGQKSGLYASTGFSEFQQGIMSLSVYYVAYGAIALSTAIPLAQVIKKLGHQQAMVFSYLLRLVGLLLLYLSATHPLLIFLAVAFESIQSNLFWPSYYTVLSQNTLKNQMGKDLGILQFLLQLVAVVSPALSGLVAVMIGLESIFLIALAGTLIGMIFTLFMEVKNVKDEISLREFMTWLKESRFRKLTVSIVGRYINDAALYVWPLYVFIFLGSVDKVGYLYTISLFLAMIFTYFISIYIDHHKSRRPFFLSGGILTLLWVARTQLLSVFSIALIDVVERLTSNFHWLFFDTVLIRRSKGSNALSYFVYREMILNATAIGFWLLFAGFFLFDFGWNSIFLFASVGVALSLLMRDKEKAYVES